MLDRAEFIKYNKGDKWGRRYKGGRLPVRTWGDDWMEINSSGNVYEQIVNHYKKYISLGILKSGDKLPSCREFAISIGVNHKTVERAYAQLVKEGIIVSPKKGYFVPKEKKQKNPMVRDVLSMLKTNGISKDEIQECLDELFEEESKWLK